MNKKWNRVGGERQEKRTQTEVEDELANDIANLRRYSAISDRIE